MSRRRQFPVIGLVGGVGSGKSAVAGWLSSRRNVIVIDGDEVGRRLLALPEVKEQIRERFGGEVFDGHGEVVRAKLAREVFGTSASHKEARTDLERILHPRIEQSFRGTISAAETSNRVEAVVLDAAVLLEAGWGSLCDFVVFIDTPAELRLRWVREGRGWDQADLERRESCQLSLKLKRSRADYVIPNTGAIAHAGKQLEQLATQYSERQQRQRPESNSG